MIGIIGGSGVNGIGDEDTTTVQISTAWGEPSAPLVVGKNFAFIPRHGIAHEMYPHEVPYRANIAALGDCNMIVAICAVGSLNEKMKPGDMVVPDQLIDITGRPCSYNTRPVNHNSAAMPFDFKVRHTIRNAAAETSAPGCLHFGGTYICINGPRFSTRAESLLYKSWGADIIGMTAAPEAFLASETGVPYAVLAIVTDYDCWKPDEDPVTLDILKSRLAKYAGTARQIAMNIVANAPCAKRADEVTA